MNIKDSVLAAACYIQAKEGDDGVTIKNVAVRAKLRTCVVHHHFPNDRLLLKAVTEMLSPPSK
jgi:AcrR family transcriptional regulator